MATLHLSEYDMSNDDGLTALHLAALNSDIKEMKSLLDAGAQVDIQTEDGLTALHFAAIVNNVAGVKMLLEAGANCDILCSNEQNALAFAQSSEYLDRLEDNTSSDEQKQARRRASKKSHYDVMKLLLEAGSSVREAGSWAALFIAIKDKSNDIVELLLTHGADPHRFELDDMTPLEYALTKGNITAAEMLIKYGANPHVRGKEGSLIIHRLATHMFDFQTLFFAVKMTHTIDSVDIHGRTALHCACIAGNENAIIVLLKFSANHRVRDIHGMTAMDILKEKENKKLVTLMSILTEE